MFDSTSSARPTQIIGALPSLATAKKAIYFPGLNALRYIAAAMVVFCHVEEFKKNNLLPHYYNTSFVHDSGSVAVTFFFVLSGFLITYLLLQERAASGTVAVRNFYVRRALRIWPVYYLISLLGLFVMPYIAALVLPHYSATVPHQYPVNVLLYFFFLPNIALQIGYFVPYASQLWSVGVEEQFYLFWPWVFKLIKKPLPVVVAIIIIFLMLRVGSDFLTYHWLSPVYRRAASLVYGFLMFTRIDCMAFGGVGAYLIHKEGRWFRQYFINPIVEIGSLLGVAILMMHLVPVSYLENDLYSLFFLLLIVNIACGERSLLRLESRVWTFLGNISYSVYMYQYLAIGLVLFLSKKLAILPVSAVPNFVFHLASQGLTLILAYLSYRFFEMPFLELKKKFMVVKSTDKNSN